MKDIENLLWRNQGNVLTADLIGQILREIDTSDSLNNADKSEVREK